jgi:hypothetical protein
MTAADQATNPNFWKRTITCLYIDALSFITFQIIYTTIVSLHFLICLLAWAALEVPCYSPRVTETSLSGLELRSPNDAPQLESRYCLDTNGMAFYRYYYSREKAPRAADIA